MDKKVTSIFPVCVEISGKTARESLNIIKMFKTHSYKDKDNIVHGQMISYKGANAVYCLVYEQLPTIVLQFYFQKSDKKKAIDFKLTFS